MTDNEIVSVFNNAAGIDIVKVYLWDNAADKLVVLPLTEVADFINRQKAEIERLTAERDEARHDCAVAEHNHQLAVAEREANVKGFTETLKTAKADGIIEFWNTLKARNTMDERIVSVVTGDNLVKEMVGEDSNTPIVDKQN